jgi:glycosyltransferase 2 family protein
LVAWLFWRADPAGVWSVLTALGPWAPLLLCPYGVVYLIDTLGWRLTFGRHLPAPLSFGRLFRIRWAGESVNTLVPSGYLGGEAVKVYLLHQAGVSGWTGTTSVVVSKTAQTVAQVLFIGLGALLGAMRLPPGSPFRTAFWTLTGVALTVLLVLIAVQYYGFFKSLNRLAACCQRWRNWFERHRQRLHEVDDSIRSFYHCQPRWFLLSTGAYFAGWLFDTVEIWLVSALLGWQVDWPRAAAMEAFIGVAKALGTFVPASLGVQESGVVLLFRAFGLTPSQAIAYALLRRGRDLVYALVGLALLWTQESSLKRLRAKIAEGTASTR